MRIVIDARSVVERKSGIGNYVESLVKHLVPIAEDVRFVLVRHPDASWPILEHPRVEECAYRGETKSVHTLLGMGIAHPFGDADLYHAPAELVPLGLRCPWVVTFHDLMWIEEPALASAFAPVRLVNSAWYRLNYRRAITGARRVIAISQATADAIGRVYPDQADKVTVVHHGIDFKRYDVALAGSRASLESIVPAGLRYSLIVGQGSPYKNHAAMIRAFIEATRTDADHRLVLVRRFSRVDSEMRQLLDRADVRKKVIAVPFVSDATLLALYRHAVMLLFASHYEGFGLPGARSDGDRDPGARFDRSCSSRGGRRSGALRGTDGLLGHGRQDPHAGRGRKPAPAAERGGDGACARVHLGARGAAHARGVSAGDRLVRRQNSMQRASPDDQARAQSSTRSPLTRRNSLVLLVTKVRPIERACAAIRVSRGPIGRPLRDSSARRRP